MSNNRTKLFLLFTLIFIATIGLSAATAADIDNNATDTPVIADSPATEVVDEVQTTDVDNKAGITKNTQTNVKTDGEANFDDLKTDIDAGSEVTLTKDYTHVSGDYGLISINSDKTIDGAGHTISNVTSGLFSIPAGNTLTLKNLIITAGESTGAHVITLNGNLICENVIFDMGNSARFTNSIVYYNDAGATASFTNCEFKNFNTSSGGVYLYKVGTVTADNCTFKNISANNNPLKLNNGASNATILNSKFLDNIGANQGGAICFNNMNNKAVIDNCLFENNIASAGGGAIRTNGNLTLTNSIFRNNKNSGSGSYAFGAICMGNANANLITSNNVMEDPDAQLAEIFIYDGKIHGAKITGETINADANEEVTVTYSITDDNGNGVIYRNLALKLDYNDNQISISNDTDVNRGVITKTVTAPAEDGTYPATLIYDETRFVDPVVTVAEVIVGNPSPSGLIITDATYSNFFNEDGTIISGAIAEDSVAKFDGTFTNRQFVIDIPMTMDTGDNQAVFDGCTITVNNDVTIKNIEATNTNVIVSTGKTLNLYNTSFADLNAAKRVFEVNRNAKVNAEKSTFTNLGTWGVFYLLTTSEGNFKDCVFTNCSNTAGGAIEIRGNGVYVVDNCTFIDNSATLRGGAIYSKGNLTIRDSEFKGNKVTTEVINKNQGGAVLYVEGSLYLYDNVMTDNIGLTADIYNSYATIYTPVHITIDDVSCEEGSEVNLTATITDADGNTIDLIAEANGISGLEDTEYLTHLNLTVEDNKYNVTRNQSLKGQVTRTIAPELEVGNYTIGAEVWADELVNPVITTGNLEIIEAPVVSYTKLQNMIDEATEDTITVDMDVVRGATETTVKLNKSITIDLNGLTWDATQGQAIEVENGATATIKNGLIINVDNTEPSTSNAYGRLARVTSGNLVFENVTITNCTAPDFGTSTRGSLVRITTGSGVTLNNCTVEDIKGRFIIDNGKGTININDTYFNNNKLGSTDSLIENGGVTTINNTQFNDNTANWGIVYGKTQKDLITIDNTIFANNQVSVGAPLVTGADAKVINSKFLNNKATNSYTAKSGAIYTDSGSLTVYNSTFIGNTNPNTGKYGTIISHSGYFPGDLNVSNSVLIPADSNVAIYNSAEDDITAVANYNYWGTNSTPANYVKSGSYYDDYDDECDCTPVEVKYWVVMNTTITPEEFGVDEDVTIETSYNKYTDGTNFNDLEGAFPEMEITYTVSEGSTTPESATTENGVANVAYKVAADSFTVTATDSYTTNVINAEATPTEPVVITLNDGNWTEYFNDDGTTKRVVTPGSELRFEGEFNNRHMIITSPLNLTTADTQAVLKNSSFTVIAGDVNITNIQMIGDDVEDSLIYLENSTNSRIENNVLTHTNTAQKVVTHTIDVSDSDNIVIRNNTITTTGPEVAIDYDGKDQIKLVYTSAIYAKNTNAIVIDSNKVTVNGNGKTETVGTVYAINVMGEFIYDEDIDMGESDYTEHDYLANAKIINNVVSTKTGEYGYAINVGHAVGALVDNNTITATGENYADAIQGFNVYNTKFTNNKINITSDKMAYGIIANGFMYMYTSDDWSVFELSTLIVEGNEISNNVIDMKAKDAWAIETVIAYDNTVQYNNITINAGNGVGIGFADAEESTAQYNNINIKATQESSPNTGDAVDSYTAGIKITPSASRVSTPDSNTAVYNNITITAVNSDVPAVNVSSASNEITDNYLVSPVGVADNAVLDTGEDNTVENNIPLPEIITLNDGNWTEYFNEDGTPKNTVIPGSELRFEGEFNDRYMIITIPLNLTTAETQAVLKNSQFLVVANNVNITNVQMAAQDTEDPLVLSEDANGLSITDSTFNVTNTEDEMITRAIQIDGGSDVLIYNNTITTVGPEDPIEYGADSSIRAMYLASIESTAEFTTILNNRVTTKKNELESKDYGTIYGLYVHGNGEEKINNAIIANNEIATEGEKYDYGIILQYANDSTIQNNTVDVRSKLFASGAHPFVLSNSTIADNTINTKADNLTYGIVLEGAMLTGSYEVVNSEYNTVINNIVNLESQLGWGIELYAGNHNNVTYNNITVRANNALGVGVGDYDSIISYNNIEAISDSLEITVTSYDYIDPYTTGVKIAENGLQIVQNNNITFNNITVTAPSNEIYAVNSSTNGNIITDNYLLAPASLGDNAVINTGSDVTIENNKPDTIITDETYPVFFDENSVFKPAFNNTNLTISGNFTENTVFIFDGVNATITSDGTATIIDGQVFTGNNATMTIDGWKFENTMDAIVLESEGNVINNTVININSEDAIHAIYVYEAGNTISNTVLNITAPSADVEYNPDYSTKSPAPAAIVISSNNNLVDNVTVTFNANTSTGFYPTVDGIYVVSEKTPVVNNTIKDTTVTVTGTNYVYGINVGNAKDTKLENVTVNVDSLYYADAIQLFDADTISITGTANAQAVNESYGVYSTAMGYGISQNIDLTGLNVSVEAEKATGVLIEGAINVTIANATYEIEGREATAVNAHVDFMGNIPGIITVTGTTMEIEAIGDSNILYFGNATDVTITNNNITATGGKEININATPNAVITDNYITVGEMLETGIFGNYAVITTEDDTVIENNTPTSKLIDDLNDKISELEDEINNLTSAKNTSISIDPLENVQYGDEITISGLLVNEDYIGVANQNVTIKFNDEETTVTTRNGEFTYTTTATLVGENTVTVSYAGSDKYRASEATYTFEVSKANAYIELSDLETVKKGDTLTISGVLYDHNNNTLANKVVRLLVNNGRKTLKTNDMGEFSFDYTTSRVGNNTLTATFEETDLYKEFTVIEGFEVKALSTIITIDDMSSAIKGAQTTISGKLTDENGNAIANAQVRITVNGSPKTVKTDSEGKFTHTYTFGQVGENTITATYAGSTNYDEATTETTVEVAKAKAVITLDDMESVSKGESATFTGKLTDEEGNAIANAQVKLTINGSQKTLKTDANGVFTHTFKMTKEGTNNITAVFNGNNDYAAANTNSTVEVVIKTQ